MVPERAHGTCSRRERCVKYFTILAFDGVALEREVASDSEERPVANWRATVDEDGHYSFAVAL